MEIEFKLKLKGTDKEFKSGLGQGILASETVDFDISKDDLSRPIIIAGLLEAQEEFLKRYIEVVMLYNDEDNDG